MSFGELRALLHQTPSQAAWAKVCAFLERAHDEDASHAIEVLLPYAEELLQRAAWPPLMRLAPWAWLEPVVLEGRPSPLLAMTCGAELVAREIFDPGVVNLARAPEVRNWSYLVLMRASVGDLAVESIVDSPYFHDLETLKLHENHINGRGAAALARWPGAANLIELDLGKNELLGHALAPVFEAPRDWSRLRRLDLSWTKCSDATLQALCDNPTLVGLESLLAFGLGSGMSERLRASLPALETLMM